MPWCKGNGNGRLLLNYIPIHHSPSIDTSRPRQNGRYFPDGSFKCIFLTGNVWISIKSSLNVVPKGPSNNIPVMVQVMSWLRSGDKPFSEPMMVSLLRHIYVTRPQWLKAFDCRGHIFAYDVILLFGWGLGFESKTELFVSHQRDPTKFEHKAPYRLVIRVRAVEISPRIDVLDGHFSLWDILGINARIDIWHSDK